MCKKSDLKLGTKKDYTKWQNNAIFFYQNILLKLSQRIFIKFIKGKYFIFTE